MIFMVITMGVVAHVLNKKTVKLIEEYHENKSKVASASSTHVRRDP